MKSLSLSIAILLTFSLLSCNQQGKKNAEDAKSPEVVTVNIHELTTHASEYAGKTVRFTGIADHVCKMDGKKMFLIGENPEDRIKVTTGKKLSPFNVEMEGSTVEVTGIVKELKIDEAYLSTMEQGLQKTSGKQMGMEGAHEKGNKEIEQMEQANQLKALREQLEKSGKDHISIYSVEGIEVKEMTKIQND